ncbi:MAG TPA: PAS domain S-box protein [Polyangia bacterium]|jgi:PAS domain S-box-containing protein|nr:PAS domain S-box protein [Polyangia bacterium]
MVHLREPGWEVLAAVMARASEAVAIFDREERCLYVNPAAERFVGRTRAELLGGPLRGRWPESVMVHLERAFGQILAGGTHEVPVDPSGLPEAAGGDGPWIRPEVFAVGDAVGVLWRDVTAKRWRGACEEARAQRVAAERQAVLKETELREYERILEQMPVGVMLVRVSGEVALVNRHARVLLRGGEEGAWRLDGWGPWGQWGPSDASGSSANRGAMHPDGQPYAAEEMPAARVLREGLELVEEELLCFRDSDEALLWLRASAAPLRDAAGGTTGALVVLQEITAQKLAEKGLRRSERKFRRLYESGLLGIFFGDPDGQVVEANDAFLGLIGYGREDLVAGQVNWRAMTPPEYAARDERAVEELCRQGMFTPYEKEYVRKDGARIPVVLGGTLSEQRDTAMAFVLDVTDRKQAEVAREALVEQLQRSVRFSELFVAVLGHDLRNPLNAILAAGWHLTHGAWDERVTRFASTIVASGRRMERMIEHLLDFTRIRLGRGLGIEPRTTDLGAVARSILDELESAYLGRTMVLRCDGDVIGQWDGDRLGQVISNLVGNALQYSFPERPVGVTLDGTQDEEVSLEVHSVGPPIPAERLATLFEPSLGAPRRPGGQNRGLGLGLYITQQIVLAHAGSIAAQSSATEGTTFRVRLPRVSQAAKDS